MFPNSQLAQFLFVFKYHKTGFVLAAKHFGCHCFADLAFDNEPSCVNNNVKKKSQIRY